MRWYNPVSGKVCNVLMGGGHDITGTLKSMACIDLDDKNLSTDERRELMSNFPDSALSVTPLNIYLWIVPDSFASIECIALYC